MLSRIRTALGLTLLLTLITSITVFAKGSFSFINITSPEMKELVRATDPALTADFFAFADFYQDKTEAPADPGVGYEITRYYIDGGRESAFDHLHYYPDSGYVFYDGIVNGSSEYDGKWYTAEPEIKTAFGSALGLIPAVKTEPQSSIFQSIESSALMVPSSSFLRSQSIILISITAGLVILALVYWRRRSLLH